MQTTFADVPDALWERVERWIAKRSKSPKGGRPRVADRRAMSGILYRLRTGCQWDATPSEFGSRSTCYRRFVEWTQEGVFRMMHIEMLLTDGRGVVLGVTLTGANVHDKWMPLLFVAVIVALAVGAPVSVAALLNGSAIVKVIDAVRRIRGR